MTKPNMNPNANENQMNVENERNSNQNELNIQSDRVRKILDEAIYKIKLLTFLPKLLEKDGQILRDHLPEIEVNFILFVCTSEADEDFQDKIITTSDKKTEFSTITDMLNRINMNEKKSSYRKRRKSFATVDNFEAHVAYAIDLLLKSKSLVDMLSARELVLDPLTKNFIDAIEELRRIVDVKLNVTATEEINRENDLKTAYRAGMLLSDNITELEEQMEKQREELGNEYDKKAAIMSTLTIQIEELKRKAENDIYNIVNESELIMMKDYIKSSELQEQLAVNAKQASHQYETLLEDHLHQEKLLRTRCFKIETQLASWLTKYDTEIGDKQAEYEDLEHTFNVAKEEFEILQEKFDIQNKEYVTLMKEKMEEERLIYEERAYQFLINRSARKIQRYWRAYKERKRLRKKGRRSKKKGSADKKKGKKEKKKEEQITFRGGPDPNAIIDTKFGGDIMSEIKDTDAFAKKDVVVDLNAE